MSPADDRLSRSWAAAAGNVAALLWRTCRLLKPPGTGTGRTGEGWFPITLGPPCDAVHSGPGAVRVGVRVRQRTVAVNRPVRVRQAVPGSAPLLGPYTAAVPAEIGIGQASVKVSVDPLQLVIGLYLGRVDDAMGAGTPFVIYLDGLPSG